MEGKSYRMIGRSGVLMLIPEVKELLDTTSKHQNDH